MLLRDKRRASLVIEFTAPLGPGRNLPKVFWVGLTGGFYILVLVVEQKMVTKWYSNWSPGLIFGAFYTMF